jgi:hypothetical protein
MNERRHATRGVFVGTCAEAGSYWEVVVRFRRV